MTAATDGAVRVWDLAKREVVGTLSGHQGPVSSARFSPDGRRIISASEDGTARLWDAAGGQQLAILQGHEGRVLWAGVQPGREPGGDRLRRPTARIWPIFPTTQALIDYAKTIVPRPVDPRGAQAVLPRGGVAGQPAPAGASARSAAPRPAGRGRVPQAVRFRAARSRPASLFRPRSPGRRQSRESRPRSRPRRPGGRCPRARP